MKTIQINISGRIPNYMFGILLPALTAATTMG